MPVRALLLTATMLGAAPVAAAQEDRIETLERKLAEQQARIDQLEALVARQTQTIESGGDARQARAEETEASRAPGSATGNTPEQARAEPSAPFSREFGIAGLDVGGDLRVRQEWNSVEGRNRSRTALRGRLRAQYAAGDHFSVGAQLSTGDPDDPNTADVTLGSFVDDLAVSLDRAWIGYRNGGFAVDAGKFPQPFQRTDMVWDGDVSPQGIAVTYGADAGGVRVDARSLYFIIDEAAVARDSDMLGAQLALAAPLASSLKAGVAGSYYHYRLGTLAGADTGDFRGNLLEDGHYLSDFHLIEAIATLGWNGPSERWPINLTADYVRNLGAAVKGDTGFNIELAAGRAAEPGDWRLAYNYSEVEVDAVLAAFSHDNLDLSTNYRLHGLGLSHVPAHNLQLDLLWYHYRPLDPIYAGSFPPDSWRDRIRLAFTVGF